MYVKEHTYIYNPDTYCENQQVLAADYKIFKSIRNFDRF